MAALGPSATGQGLCRDPFPSPLTRAGPAMPTRTPSSELCGSVASSSVKQLPVLGGCRVCRETGPDPELSHAEKARRQVWEPAWQEAGPWPGLGEAAHTGRRLGSEGQPDSACRPHCEVHWPARSPTRPRAHPTPRFTPRRPAHLTGERRALPPGRRPAVGPVFSGRQLELMCQGGACRRRQGPRTVGSSAPSAGSQVGRHRQWLGPVLWLQPVGQLHALQPQLARARRCPGSGAWLQLWC